MRNVHGDTAPIKHHICGSINMSMARHWRILMKGQINDIEKAFCDPSKTESGYTSYLKLKAPFQHLPSVHESHFTDGSNMLYR